MATKKGRERGERREKIVNLKKKSCARTERLKLVRVTTYKVAYIANPMCETTRKPNILANTRDKEVIHQNGVV